MENAKTLQLKFKRIDQKNYNLVLKNPREDITEEEIKKIMNMIIEKNIINPSGMKIEAIEDASIVDTSVKKFNLGL
ncbi:MAG: DUF2922 domain-containing protein [Peptostreptococcus sp.]|uniref:DUF2922 domain-containing protein n=1 Tax=Peptostreptococcus sp. TaxID=1262 RepID=UPI002FC6A1F3